MELQGVRQGKTAQTLEGFLICEITCQSQMAEKTLPCGDRTRDLQGFSPSASPSPAVGTQGTENKQVFVICQPGERALQTRKSMTRTPGGKALPGGQDATAIVNSLAELLWHCTQGFTQMVVWKSRIRLRA